MKDNSITINEIPNSRLDEKFQYLHILGSMEKTGIAIYSA